MKSRRQAREAALQALYMCDTLQLFSSTAIELYFANFQAPEQSVASETREIMAFARTLCMGAVEHREEFDRYIAAASTHWSINRMTRIDRNILRVAAYELAFIPDVPVNVTMNEAIEIAKRFASDESPQFINGVLDRLASIVEYRCEKAAPQPRAARPRKAANEA